MRYLNAQQIIYIHDQLLKQFGGKEGIANMKLLESAIFRPRASFAGDELFPTIFSKAAALGQALIHNQVFVDGNAQTAFTAIGVFLIKNKYRLFIDPQDKSDLSLFENPEVSFEETMKWLKRHAKAV